jgi:hypothetical protein
LLATKMNTTSQESADSDLNYNPGCIISGQFSRDRYTMSNFDATRNGKPSEQELSVEELEKAVGGGAKKGASKNSDEGPKESLSLNYTKIVWSYTE